MDLRLSDAEIELQQGVRAWLAETLPGLPPPPDPGDWMARRAYDTGWQRRLHDAGYAGLHWPKEFGGQGATPTEQLVFLEELSRAQAPTASMTTAGNMHAGPTLIAEASDELRARYLPGILRGDHIWCQGFSERDAGSDLASLRTRAVRDGGEYVISGHKIWTSFAHVADFCEMLVRTDADVDRKHRGITWLVVPMNATGITVRPIRTMAGTEEFSEVFFDEVRVPVSNRVGEEGDGWRVAMVTFSFERGTAFVSELIDGIRLARELGDMAHRLHDVTADGIRRDLGWCVAQLDGLWSLNKRNVTRAQRNAAPDARGGSVMKLHLSDVWNRLADVGLRVLERRSLALDDLDEHHTGRFVEEKLRSLCFSLGGGTSEIQRNILAERVLGLPREPSASSAL